MLEVGISGVTLPKAEHDSIRLKEIQKRNQMVAAKHKLLKLLQQQGVENTNLINKILDIEFSQGEIQIIIEQIKTKILNEDPKSSDLKLGQKLRIGRIILRALRIVLIESEIIGIAWIVVLGILKVLAILSVGILEILLTVIMVICGLIEKLQEKVMGERSQ